MPLEVSEIGISMRVSGDEPRGGHAGTADYDRDPEEWREDLIAECVQRVLQVLRAERER